MTNFEFIEQWVADSSFSYHHQNLSNRGPQLFSYSTCIALKCASIDNKKNIMLIADQNFSQTTAKHLCSLGSAVINSKANWHIIYVPFEYGSDYNDQSETYRLWSNTLESLILGFDTKLRNLSKGLTRQEYRYEFVLTYNNFKTFVEELCPEWKYSVEEFKDTFVLLESDPTGKTFKQLQREKLAKEKALIKKTLKVIKVTGDFEPLKNLPKEILKNYWGEGLNYVKTITRVGEKYYNLVTNQGVRVCINYEELITALSKVKNHELQKGETVAGYPIGIITDKYIKVGCHKMSVKNLLWILDVFKKMYKI